MRLHIVLLVFWIGMKMKGKLAVFRRIDGDDTSSDYTGAARCQTNVIKDVTGEW